MKVVPGAHQKTPLPFPSMDTWTLIIRKNSDQLYYEDNYFSLTY